MRGSFGTSDRLENQGGADRHGFSHRADLSPKGEIAHNSGQSGGAEAASTGGDEIRGKTEGNRGFLGVTLRRGEVAEWLKATVC